MRNRRKIIIVAVSSIVTVLFIIVMVPWGIMFGVLSFLPNPSKPEITRAEFPFTLEYSINGEKKTVGDTLICEYDGIEINAGQGKIRKWKSHLVSGDTKIYLLKDKNIKSINTNREPEKAKLQEIYFYPGEDCYYMGDMDYYDEDFGYPNFENKFPIIYIMEKYEDGDIFELNLEEVELFEKFGIKLVNWKHASPIKNTFK